ncbi:MAG TPA: hypothetical protein VGO31_10600 [Microbacteriaceae bacterium]|jgi:hypothetical protein|nr:hypothetical protein [Microbacteriaceae bacterium]
MDTLTASVAVATLAVALVVPSVVSAASPLSARAEVAPYRVAMIGAYLFYNDSGAFSPNIPADAALWNTIIGEGWARESSTSTLVRVVVTGANGSYEPHRAIQLTVSKGRRAPSGKTAWRTPTRKTQGLSVLSARGRTVVGFWIYDTGCEPLKLTATVTGQAPTRPAPARVIMFACGE